MKPPTTCTKETFLKTFVPFMAKANDPLECFSPRVGGKDVQVIQSDLLGMVK